MAEAACIAAAVRQRPTYRARQFDEWPDRARARRHLAAIAAGRLQVGPVPPTRPLALYGAGKLGLLARDFLAAVGHDFDRVIDRQADVLRADPAWAGVELVHPDDVSPRYKAEALLAVSVATSAFVPLQRDLHRSGFDRVVPFYDIAEHFRSRHPLGNGWFAPPLAPAEVASVAEVLDGWDDDLSRAHHLQFLAWRQLREEWVFADPRITNHDRFFTDEVVQGFDDDTVFVDAGAHHGAVCEQFHALCGGRFRQLVAIEPDARSRSVLVRSIARTFGDDPRVQVSDAVLAAAPGPVRFHGGLGYASQIAETGTWETEAVTLDALGLAPTVLKLHLEGAERGALAGALRTLTTHRPVCTVTVYHNADGRYETAQWLMRALPNYRFQFRLHSWCGTGAVIYAFPNAQGRADR